MKTGYFYLYMSILLITACTSSPKQQTVYNIKLISQENVVQKGIEQLDSLIGSYEFIPLETDDSSLLSDILNVRYYNDKFFVTSSVTGLPAQIFVFDRQGKFLNKIGNIGHGPGEYLGLSAWYIEPKD